ncbi:hypothetical protein LguiB_026451 [Lonicera macranthoides]
MASNVRVMINFHSKSGLSQTTHAKNGNNSTICVLIDQFPYQCPDVFIKSHKILFDKMGINPPYLILSFVTRARAFFSFRYGSYAIALQACSEFADFDFDTVYL